jgi:hypothetical protein
MKMTDQVEVQEKVRWEDLEVAEEQEITEWQEGNEPTPTRYKCCVDLSKPGSDFTAVAAQGIILAFGISAEEFADALEGQARAALEKEIDFLNTPVLGAVDCNNWREANERLPAIGEMVARMNAFCTPSRNNLTGRVPTGIS